VAGRDAKLFDGQRRNTRRITLVGLRDFDDLLGDDMRYGVGAIDQPKRLECDFRRRRS
jgi:hypothetical protein